ncbi:MAG: hypothetical protein Q8O67_15955 [Deltaproteobacteria bacterium]|nr:hypothetical protein [Deltaproteobacteria bacterium]
MNEQRRPAAVAVVVFFFVTALLMSCASAPRGTPGPAADALAARIESAVGLQAFDELAVVSWSFRGKNHWLWDRARGVVRLQNAAGTVLLDTWDHGGFVLDSEGKDVVDADRLATAWTLFINDSFWLNPFATLRNQDAQRELVDVDGAPALLIRFEGGGITPGDSYLFFVDDKGLPTRWKLWVQVLPVKGFETTFEDWVDVDGARFATSHKGGPGVNVGVAPVKGGKTLQDAAAGEALVDDPFTRLIARRR